MNEPLTPYLRDRIARKVESGLYDSSEAVLEKALELLDDYDEELADVREKVSIAKEQVRNGQYTDYTDETLPSLFDDISQQGLKRLASGESGRTD
jgi:Arc/MetJ-type ribon-helix-helix transcriptional regulator